jgi:hypothetical protein
MTRTTILLALAACALGCGETFDPASRLLSPRVLALRSEPVAPATGETTTLTPLVYLPPGMAVDRYAWSWCPLPGPASEGYPCLVGEDELAGLGGGGAIPPYDLGDGETATFENSLDPALLTQVCDGSVDQPALIACDGGFPAQVRLRLTAGDTTIDVVRQLRLRFRDEDEANANPTIGALTAELDGGDAAIDDDGTVVVRRREEHPIRVDVPDDVVEPYTGRDDDGEPTDARERIILSWFVETGDLDDERTSYVPAVVPELPDALDNVWEPDPDLDSARDTSELVVVVRDDRDGVAWTRGRVTLGDAR